MSNVGAGDRFFEFARGSSHPPLTDGEKEILDFGRNTWPNIGQREVEIRKTFGYDSTRYFQRLRSLKDHPEAVAYAPEVVRKVNEVINRQKESGYGGRGYR